MADDPNNNWGSPFPEVDDLNDNQLLFITVLYAVILYQSSNLIADGSELLLLIPSLAGLVGSIVLPILGAVPDGMMTLASGMGEDAQSTVGAGVGVLAGSTVMLLTFPWFLAILSGRVPLNSETGEPCYDKKANLNPDGTMKNSGTGLFDSGIAGGDSIKKNAKIMLATTLIYMVIQIPALSYDPQPAGEDVKGNCQTRCQAQHESTMALIGLVVSVAAFFGYLIMCYIDSKKDAGNALDAIIEGIKNRQVSLGAALEFASKNVNSSNSSGRLENESKDTQALLQKVLKPFFIKYDDDKSGTLEFNEFQFLMDDLGEKLIEKEKKKMFRDACMMQDRSSDAPKLNKMATTQLTQMNSKQMSGALGKLQFSAFCQCMYSYVSDPDRVAHAHKEVEEALPAGGDDEDEEEEEVPEDLADLPPDQQRAAILRRALWMMGMGTFIVVFVSDPFVDCLTAWGDRLGVPTFYISFVVAPFASNASELLSAYAYAAKKTKSSITTSLSTLIGAACMNNTFCLAIFFALIYFKQLAWQFTAETASIMVIQWLIGLIAIFKSTQSFATAFVVLACYPACLGIVYGMENVLNFD
jgi:Ca2+/Na+ antiporter